jgi:hypothetical protein
MDETRHESIECCLEQRRRVLDLVGNLLAAADEATTRCEDDRCLIVFGAVRDNAYAIRRAIDELPLLHEANSA